MDNALHPYGAKFATLRNPARPTLGPIVGRISQIVRGRRLMPWQQYVADVVCELSTEYPGEWHYLEGDVTVPRQAGKSDLVNALHTSRLLMFKAHHAMMTAQTGKDAGKRWGSLVSDLNISTGVRSRAWKVSRGKGAELVTNLGRGSTLAPFPPTEDAVHGDALNFVTLDETWAFTEAEGAALETAVKPTFLTQSLSQLMRVSTRGTANSAYLNSNIAAGRQATQDTGSRRFFFEWSANEEAAEADPYSDETLSFHPALGHTQSARKIRDLGKDMSAGAWRRSFLNLETATGETAIDLATWDARRWNYAPQTGPRYRPARPEDRVLAWDIAADGSGATVIEAWLNDEGVPAVAHLASGPGTGWLRPLLERLAAEGYRSIIADESGPNTTMLQDLPADLGIEAVSFSRYGTACQSLLDRLREGTLEHDGHASYEAAISVAALTRTQKATIFNAKNSAGPIDAIRALALAQHEAADKLTAGVLQIF